MTYHEFLSRDYVLFPTLVWRNCHEELEKMTLEEYDELKKEWDKKFEEGREEAEKEAEEKLKAERKAKNRADLSNILETFGLVAIGIILAAIGENAGPGFWWFIVIVDIVSIVCVLAA